MGSGLFSAYLNTLATNMTISYFRSEVTFVYLAKLIWDHGFDMVILTKYAPGQSAKNNIEHLWAPTTNRLASVILYPGSKDEGGDGADDEETEVRVQKKVGTKTVETDEDIQTVKGLLSDFSFSGYKVEPVAIKCESDDVEIGGEVLNTAHYNEIEKWKKFFFGKKLTRARMQGANSDPEERKLRSELQDVCHHIDKRAHRWENLRILELIFNSTASSFANAFANWERRCVKSARKTHLSSLMPS